MSYRKKGSVVFSAKSRLHKNNQELLTKGFAHHQKGELIAAGTFYAEILQNDPRNFDALHLSGLIAAQGNQYDLAIKLILQALSINPADASAHCNLGNVFLNQNKYVLAIEQYSKAILRKSNYEEAFYSRGLAYQKLGQFKNAEEDYLKAIAINSKHIGTHTNLGNVYQMQKKYNEAINCYENAINLGLPIAEPFNNRGNLFHELKRYKESLLDFDEALKINPNYPEALSNKGNSLFALKKYDEAIFFYNKAIAIKPSYAEAHHNRGNLYKELKNYELAAADYEKALIYKPDYEYVKGVLLGTRMHLCSWQNLQAEWDSIQERVKKSEKIITPFLALPICDSIEIQRKVAQIWVQDKHPYQDQVEFEVSPLEGRKIRIGYFSGDFHEHATMYLMAQLFEEHDKSKYEIIGFSFGPDKHDAMRIRALDALDQFHDVRDMTDVEVAQFSRDLGIDIAVDLKGFTQDSRLGIFSHRAAPIQVNYLGYPGTIGADFIDYIIADRTVIPERLKHLYSEEVAYLPNCYQVNDQKRAISDRRFSREEVGLPKNGFVFCCFNANYKITPATFDGWMRILLAVPDSVLWLFEDCSKSAENLRNEALNRGVEPLRLVFARHMQLPEHLARHQLADLFLDTLPCNAHTTTSDALWAGLPVLTCAGEAFASRVAASLLNAVGLPELITTSQDEYEKVAIEIATNPSKLIYLKSKLTDNIKSSPLFDTEGFTRDLENLYIWMLNNKKSRVLPQ